MNPAAFFGCVDSPIRLNRFMLDLIKAAIQGVVEGLTEFLPISSTAHIVIAQEFLGIDRTSSFWKMFAVFIQLGAILAVIAYFWTRLTRFVASFRDIALKPDGTGSVVSKLLKHPLSLVLLSFVVTAIPCFLIDKFMDKFMGDNLESLTIIGIVLIVGGIAMYWIDWYCSKHVKTEQMDEMNLRQAIVIGLAQILAAAFPGTSRSMSTIAGGQLMGLSRSAALEFSFFLSIPVMVAAASYRLLKHVLKEGVPSGNEWMALAVGFVTSFVVAFVVIAWFMTWVRKHGFTPFAIYRVLAGIALIWWDRVSHGG